jgi:shikimate dehydrogenase
MPERGGKINVLDRLSGATRLFPIIGDPIRYVESPVRLTRTFGQRDYNGICVPMQVPADDLDAVMAGLTASRNVDGILVTMPHKLTAFAHCATSSERAKMLGVVSVIRRNRDGTWHGDMLDGLAFVKAQKDHGARPEGARVLLVGAGGAGSAIAIALLEAGVGELVIHDADESRVATLLQLLSELGEGRVSAGPPDPTGCALVCNATPMGMEDGDPLPRCCVADLVDVRRRCDRRARRHPVPPGCSGRRMQDGQRRTHGRSRTRRHGRLHASDRRSVEEFMTDSPRARIPLRGPTLAMCDAGSHTVQESADTHRGTRVSS